jgi:hypothetical protein
MSNDPSLKKVTEEEHNNWKLGYIHGDFKRMAERFKSDFTKYGRAQRTGYASDETRKEMNRFYADKNKAAKKQKSAA